MPKVIFNGDTAEIIPELLQKYGIKDIDEATLDKLEKNEPFTIPGSIILESAIKIVKKELDIKDLPALLQKELKIPATTASLLAKDIETKIVSIAKEAMPENVPSGIKAEKMPVTFTELMEKPTSAETERKPAQKEETALEEKPAVVSPKIKKPIIPPAIEQLIPKPKMTKGSDKYREAVE